MNNKQQFHSLTALKGLFILIIVLHNTFSINPLFDAVPGVSFLILFGGMLGNSMFFILSGFLLSYGYRQRISDHDIPFQNYLIRRLTKLYPIYLLTNVVSLIIAIMQHGLSVINLKKIALTLLLQMGGGLESGGPYNSPTWFLSTLFVCYISYFFICFYVKNPTTYFCALVFGIIWGYYLQSAELNIPFCYSGTGVGLLNFYIGCILSEIFLQKSFFQKGLLSQAIALCTLLLSFYLMLRYGVEIISGDMFVASAFLICPLILYLSLAEGPCAKILRLKPFVLLGNISVSIFFWHLPLYYVFELVQDTIHSGSRIQEPQYLLYLVVLLVWSMFSHCVLEKRILHAQKLSQT